MYASIFSMWSISPRRSSRTLRAAPIGSAVSTAAAKRATNSCTCIWASPNLIGTAPYWKVSCAWRGQQSWRARPLYPQKRTCAVQLGMSALGHKRTSLDQLVGALLEVKRNVESECLGGREINDQLEFGRQRDRKIARLLTFQYASNIDTGTAISIRDSGTI